MEYFDSMALASPFHSNPCTPKPRSRNFTTPSPPYKSNATVISLDSSPGHNYNSAYDIEDHMLDFLSRKQQQYKYNDNDSDATHMPDVTEYSDATHIPDLTEYSHPPNTPLRFSHANITPLKLARPRTFARHGPEDEHTIPQTLDHMVLSLPAANPPITILLVLTPQPASLAETTAFEAFGSRFCGDFGGGAGEKWSCISLYAHFRKCPAAQRKLDDQAPLGGGGEIDGNDVGIGAIHPYALRAKLDQQKEVQWRLSVPVLQALVDNEVKNGSRAFVVCGLAVGDVEGVRGFGRTIAKPAGILAFLPATAPTGSQVVPAEYSSRTVSIFTAPLSQTYDTLLAALYAKQLSTDKATHKTEPANTAAGSQRQDEKNECDVPKEEPMTDWF